jgi:integrator complex subunit 11
MQTQNQNIKILCLGAGREVGRSCVLVKIKDKKIIFDTGIHMLYSDQRRYPDFGSLYKPPETINNAIDLVIVTHFHLDHCGSLPYLT